jgi:hypothetical protein
LNVLIPQPELALATDQELQTLEDLKRVFKSEIPSGKAIATDAVRHVLRNKKSSPEWVKKHFSVLVESIQADAYERYLVAERKAWEKAFAAVFGPLHGKCNTPKEVADLICDNFYALDKFFLSLTQSRRVRAGTAFEVLIREFFGHLKYPFTPQPRIDGNPDFVLPSVQHYEADPLTVIIFTVKRSLRERWRQIVTEGAKGLGFYLATIDPAVSAVDLKAMQKQKIFLVVPATYKREIFHYATAKNVITFEDFFLSYLDPAMIRWKRSGTR